MPKKAKTDPLCRGGLAQVEQICEGIRAADQGRLTKHTEVKAIWLEKQKTSQLAKR